MKTTKMCLALAGSIIVLFNIYWLVKFDFSWNIFTYESWVMLIVGFTLIVPFYQSVSINHKFVQCPNCGTQNKFDNKQCYSCNNELPTE